MAESYFSIVTETDVLTLDATLNANRTLPSSITDFPVEDGGFASDNIVIKGDVITYAGIITDIKSLVGADNGSTEYYIKTIEAIRNNKQLVSINVGSDAGDFKTIDNCHLMSCTFTQDLENGIASKNISSYKVSLSFKKLRIISSARVSVQNIAVPLRDKVTPSADTSKDGTTKEEIIVHPVLSGARASAI